MNRETQAHETARAKASAKVWLHYYNRVLFERGLITEHERNRMMGKIDERYR